MRGTSKIVTVVAFFLVAGLTACGGGGGGSTTPPVNPPPSQAPVPGPTGSGTPAPKPTFSTTPGPSGNPSSPPSGNPSAPPSGNPSAPPSGTPSAPPTTPVPTPPTTPPPTPVPTPVVTPTPVQTATPQPTITPFAKSWVIAGEGATPKPGALDNGFKATNNAFDNRTTTKNEGSDGDLSPGDPGAIPAGGGQGPVGNTVDNISCDVSMSDNYHVHAFIGLYYNGQQVVIPDAIGIVHAAGDQVDPVTGWPNQEVYGDCFYHIHTHDDTGMIHLEDPDPTGATINDSIFTTGNLFDIWGVQVNMAQFGPFSGPVTIYTSGQFSRANQCTGTGQSSICEVGSNMYTQYFGDPMSIPIYSHEVIWFLVGSGNPDVAHLPGVSFATPK